MGYGKRALKLLKDYYQGKTTDLQGNDETKENRKYFFISINISSLGELIENFNHNLLLKM